MPLALKIVTRTRLGYKTIFPLLSMIGISYPNSLLTIKSHVGKIHAGDRMHYFLYKGKSIYECLKSPDWKVLQFGNVPTPGAQFSKFESIQIDQSPDLFDGGKDFYMLLRPDNHICYVGKDIAGISLSWLIS